MSYPWQVFEDNKVYHDHHFNGMQLAIAREYKDRLTAIRYESELIVHDKSTYLWIDPIIDQTQIQTLAGVSFRDNDLDLVLSGSSGTIQWKSISLPEPASAAELRWNDELPSDAAIEFEISFDGGITWDPAPKGSWISAGAGSTPETTQTILIRATMTEASDGSKPRLLDVALFW